MRGGEQQKNRGTPKGCRSRFSAPIRPIRRTCSVSVKTWHKQVSWLAPRRSPRAFSEQKRSNDRLSSTGETSALTVAVPLGTCTRFSLSPPCLLPAGGNLRLYSLQNHYRVRVCICQYGKRRPPNGPGKRRADSAVRRGVLRRYAGISRRNDAHYPLMRHRIPRFSGEAKCLPALSIFIKKKTKNS